MGPAKAGRKRAQSPEKECFFSQVSPEAFEKDIFKDWGNAFFQQPKTTFQQGKVSFLL